MRLLPPRDGAAMLLARAAVALVLVCTLAQAAPPDAACDAFPLDRSVERGGMRVHVLHERCTWTESDGVHTSRVARVDVLRVDPAAPHGAAHVVSLVVASEKVEHPDFSYSVRHEVVLFADGAVNATATYDGVQDDAGQRCAASAEARNGLRNVAAATPLPRCHARSFLLP